MIWDSTLSYTATRPAEHDRFMIEFDVIPTWIGRIFFRVHTVNGEMTETFVVGNDVRQGDADIRRHFRIFITPGALSIQVPNLDLEKNVQLAKGQFKSIEIQSTESVFDLDNFKATNLENNKTIFSENFGKGLSDIFSLLTLFGAIIPLLLLARFADYKIFSAMGLAHRFDSTATFYAGYFPGAVALGFIDAPLRSNALIYLAAATLVWRLAIIPRVFKRGKTALLSILLMAPASLTVAAMFGQGDVGRWDETTIRIRLLVLGAVALISLPEILFWRFSGRHDWPVAVFFASAPLIYLALPATKPFRPVQPADFTAFAAWTFIAATAAKYSLLRLYGKAFHASWALMTGAVLLFVVGAEFTVRHAAYAERWPSQDLGTQFEKNDLLFWAPKNLFAPDAGGDRPEDYVIDQVNFRSGNISNEKDAGVFRILVMGGSNVWGTHIEQDEDTWPRKLEKKLNQRRDGPRYEVVNSGVIGFYLFQLLVLHETYLKDLQYDLLVVYCGYNDSTSFGQRGFFTLRDLWAAKNAGKWDKIESFITSRGLEEKRSRVTRVQEYLRHYRLYNGMTHAIVGKRSENKVHDAPESTFFKQINPVEDFELNMKDMAGLARSKNAKIVFSTEFVWKDDSSGTPPDENPVTIVFRAMNKAAKEINAPLCDTHTWMTQSGIDSNDLVFPYDTVHLNEKGADLLADLMLKCFEENDLLPH